MYKGRNMRNTESRLVQENPNAIYIQFMSFSFLF